MTRVLFLASRLSEPSCRFRFLQFLPFLSSLGIEAEVLDTEASSMNRSQLFRFAAGFDTVLVHRVLFHWLDFALFRRSVKRYVFDFDDAIFLRDSSHPSGFRSRSREVRFRRLVRGADRVIAGNAYLRDCGAPHNSRIVLLPTCIDLESYSNWRDDARAEPVIGWIGTRGNLPYLETIGPALAQVAAGAGSPRLKVVCDAFPEIPGVVVERKVWNLEDEARDVRSFQVGVMPLPDDPWTRGKCALKVLQYMAAGVPVVCSPTGANLEVVEEGVTGYFASTAEEWAACLQRLLGDANARRRMGEAARKRVEARYSAAGNAARLAEALTVFR